MGGHWGIVKILLEQEGVNPDHADTFYDRTPLSLAAERGHEGIVKILLEREGVNPGQAGTKYGRTPLSLAAEKGHSGIVKILLEQEGVNPDHADTLYDRTPLSWAAEGGHMGIVKILMERKDVCTVMPDNTNQTLQPPALSVEHDAVVSIPWARGNGNRAAVDRGSPTSLPPSPVTRDECVVGMQPRSHDSNTNMTDFDSPPEPLPAAHYQQPRLLDPGDSIPKPADSGPSIQSPRWPQFLSIWPPEPRYTPRGTDAHPNTQSFLPFAVDRFFIIASFICLFALFLYILPSSSLDIFSFRKYLPSERLA